jgi:hypothetical protein
VPLKEQVNVPTCIPYGYNSVFITIVNWKNFHRDSVPLTNTGVDIKMQVMLWNLMTQTHFQKNIPFIMQQCTVLWFELPDMLVFLCKT